MLLYGNHHDRKPDLFPVYAGVLLHIQVLAASILSFPRIRGGAPYFSPGITKDPDFSPYTRGCSCHGGFMDSRPTLFPVYAGVLPNMSLEKALKNTFPRIRGGAPLLNILYKCRIFFSPYTRGCSQQRFHVLAHYSLFPVYAGVFLCTYHQSFYGNSFQKAKGWSILLTVKPINIYDISEFL